MLLRHVVQHRRTLICSRISTIRWTASNSTKPPNPKESKNNTKKNKQIKTINTLSNDNKKSRENPANTQNVWSMLGRTVEESESLPQAQDNSWKSWNKLNEGPTGPKARLFLLVFMFKKVDHHSPFNRLSRRCTNIQHILQTYFPGFITQSNLLHLQLQRHQSNSSITLSPCEMQFQL